MPGRARVERADGVLHVVAAVELEGLLRVHDGERRLEIAQRARDARRAAGAADERVAGRVVVLRDRLAEPAVLLAPRGVGRLPHTDRVEVRERWLRVADALDDRDLALVVERLHALEVLVEAEVVRDRQRLVRGFTELRPQVAVGLVMQRDDRLQAVVAAGELDHHEDLVVHDTASLRRVHRSREHVGDRGVAGGESRGARAEHQPRAEEVPATDLAERGDHLSAFLLFELELRRGEDDRPALLVVARLVEQLQRLR